jgi:hypothetical protein
LEMLKREIGEDTGVNYGRATRIEVG